MNEMKRVLNLGAGVQSTTLALMGVKNWEYWSASEPLPYPTVGLIGVAIFADTQSEPKSVYEHLEWLKPICKKWFPIKVVTAGNLGENLKLGIKGTGNESRNQRFVSIPAFTHSGVVGESGGVTRRQCTSEYKTSVIEKFIRYEVIGLKPYQKCPPDTGITQLLGLSYDETARVIRVKAVFQSIPWNVEFPLWQMQVTRNGCKTWLKKWYPGRVVPRSACVFCPYHTNAEWRDIKENDPEGWAESIRIDEGIRNHDWTWNADRKQEMFLHSSCKPLAEVDLREEDDRTGQKTMTFLNECEGMCGV